MSEGADYTHKNVHAGHRRRLRSLICDCDERALFEHQILEYLLTFSIRRKDTNTIAHRLIDEFGSIDKVLHAPCCELQKINGVGSATADMLHSVRDYIDYMDSEEVCTYNPRISNWLCAGVEKAGEFDVILCIRDGLNNVCEVTRVSAVRLSEDVERFGSFLDESCVWEGRKIAVYVRLNVSAVKDRFYLVNLIGFCINRIAETGAVVDIILLKKGEMVYEAVFDNHALFDCDEMGFMIEDLESKTPSPNVRLIEQYKMPAILDDLPFPLTD